MGQIVVNNFSAGFVSSDDYLNGHPNGQLRMDNLCLDETGALAISKTSTAIDNASIGQDIIALYSKYLNGKLYRFLQTADYQIWCDQDQSGNYSYNITGTGSGLAGPRPAAFGAGFGRIFTANGAPLDNKEFDGTTHWTWGWQSFQTNLWPYVRFIQAVCCPFYGSDPDNFKHNFTAYEGTLGFLDNGLAAFSTAAVTNRANIRYTGPLNLNDFTNSADVGAATDDFYLLVNWPGTAGITSVEVRACASTTIDYQNMYSHIWTQAAFSNNFNRWTLLHCKRSDFTKNGTVDWSTIAMTAVILIATGVDTFAISVPYEFYNANESYSNIEVGLDGGAPYTYYQQLLTTLNGVSGKSPLSPPTRPVFGKWSAVGIIPIDPNTTVPVAQRDPRVYEMDVYKTGGVLSGDYYFIGYVPVPPAGASATVWDTQTAIETQAQNLTASGANYLINIPGGILAIEGPVNGRMILMTASGIQFTDYMNPEAVDDRLTITPSNAADETCLFLTKGSNTILILATTQDFYEISGTWAELDGGIFDIYNRASGIKQPAISPSFCVYDNAIVYVSAGSFRQLGFSQTQVISQELAPYFRGNDSNGVPAFQTGAFDTDSKGLRWELAYAKQRLIFRVTHRDNSRSIFIYDAIKQNWTRRTDGMTCFYTEESGELLCGWPDGRIRIYDGAYLLDGTTGQNFLYTSVTQQSQSPFSRKDLFTLKLWGNTTNGTVNVTLQDESRNQAILGNFAMGNLNGGSINCTQIYIPVHGCAVDLSQRFSLILKATAPLTYFKLNSWSLDFAERPDPELFLYIAPNNFGSASKKRIRTLPLVIDTRGANVTYQPIVDNVSVSPTTVFNTSVKKTVYHLFQDDQFGVDYGGTLTASDSTKPFEFYGFMTPVSVEELPPPKLFDQIGPYALDKKGKIYGFRVRMVAFGTSINYSIYGDDVLINSGSFATQPNVDTTYEVLRLPPGLICNVIRIEFKSPDQTKPFMRWYVQLRYTVSGMPTDEKWITIAGKVNADQ